MKRTFFVGMIVFVLMAVTAMALFAQNSVDDQGRPNDPTTNVNANACYDGGSMGGTCDTRREWNCGWFIIRIEYGLMSGSSLPRECLASDSVQATSTPADGKVYPIITKTSEPYYVPTSVPVQPTFTPWSSQPTATHQIQPCDLSCDNS